MTEAEFPTVAQAWLARRRDGARVDWVPLRDGEIRPEDYGRAVDESTLLVAACHAHYRNGSLQELGQVAERVHRAAAFRCPEGDASAVGRRLRERGVIAAPRGRAVRLSPHFYDSREDVDRALDALAACLEG